ncbi:MAG: Nramp family divalent metal transporter [Candidatus Blackburnbacteria bacterium]|nr:Nramp family divalent metal transporter [Candidatus Blackburnbacteria bacterium]
MSPAPLKKASLPPPPLLRKLLGPSFILLGLGLGSGELILWPHLASNFGLGIMWGALIGITFQFFINMEIERYALVTGESIFVGFARKLRLVPIWFILSTIVPWMWPGIIGSSAVVLGTLLRIENTKFLSIGLLLFVGIILTLGPVLYKTQELIQRTLIFVGVPFIFALAIYLAEIRDWSSLALGVLGKGDGYWFIPAGLPLAAFLGALAYSGAGGNLNLAQSFYVKEKGYGMGGYAGRITSILTGKKEKVELEGTTFSCDTESINCFKRWWRLINIEHLVVFWLTGAVTMLLLALLAFITIFGTNAGGIQFLFQEAATISSQAFPILGVLFLIIAAAMLFSTQLGVLDTTSRILTENLSLLSRKHFPTTTIRRNFYLFLWLQISLGVLIFLLDFAEPLALIIIGASLNAIAMFVYIALVLWVNLTSLEKPLRPSPVRILAMLAAFLFFGGFSLFTVLGIVKA